MATAELRKMQKRQIGNSDLSSGDLLQSRLLFSKVFSDKGLSTMLGSFLYDMGKLTQIFLSLVI
ncbi:hypothetical protein DXB03_17055 [Lachnospiraceae bacterium OF11-28]|nr:hypothetical protein DXB03_17055 [Lachnospiraceae bacterium OF11-28]